MKEIKEDTNKWIDIPCSWTGRLNMVEMSVLPNFIYRFNEIPIKTSESYPVDVNKLIINAMWKGTRSRIAKVLKNKIRVLTLINFRLSTKLQ